MRIGVLASGKGSNLRNLVERGFPVVAVASNRPSCGAADFARAALIPLGLFSQKGYPSREERDRALHGWLQQQEVEMVVLAGWDRVLSGFLVLAYAGRMLNIHPSLLPAFGGTMEAVREALDARVDVTGCTVHLCELDLDTGPILLQARVPVLAGDTVETLHARIQAEEHRILPEAIQMVASRVV